MPNPRTVDKAKHDLAEGKQPSTAAGEFVREEMEHIREGKHGARSAKQAIAIGLSKARRAGVPLKAPGPGRAKPRTRRAARKALQAGRKPGTPSPRRARAAKTALQKEGRAAASHRALSRQAKGAAARRSAADRSRAAKKGAATRRAQAKR